MSTEYHKLTLTCTGDHIRTKCSLYWHHMMVIEVKSATIVRVIHYTGIEEDVTSKSMQTSVAAKKGASSVYMDTAHIKEEDIEFNLSIQEVELLRYDPESTAKHSGQDAIKRARSRLHEKEYNLLTNNCECLINWAITENSESGQVTDVAVGAAVGVGVGLGMAAVGGIAYGIYRALSGGSKEKDSTKDKEYL